MRDRHHNQLLDFIEKLKNENLAKMQKHMAAHPARPRNTTVRRREIRPVNHRDNKDPSGSFRFWVELDNLLVGGFTEVSGLRAETEVEEYREGGVNDFVHRFPKVTKYPTIILKRGVTTSVELYNWYKDVAAGTINRRSGSVVLLNQAGEEIWRWNFFEAYPVKWSGPELKSTRAEVAVETLELVHNGLKGIAKKNP